MLLQSEYWAFYEVAALWADTAFLIVIEMRPLDSDQEGPDVRGFFKGKVL